VVVEFTSGRYARDKAKGRLARSHLQLQVPPSPSGEAAEPRGGKEKRHGMQIRHLAGFQSGTRGHDHQ